MPTARRLRPALLWYGLILLTVPIGRPIVDALRPHGWLTPTLMTATALVLAGAWWGLLRLRRRGALGTRQAVVAAACAAVIVGLTLLVPQLEERWHIIQYAVLGALLSTGLRLRGWRAVVVALLAVAVAGWLDEVVQWLTPRRYYDNRDVILNAGAGALGVLSAALTRRLRP